jgi:nucleoside-diphosphate-sugar epimerase
MARHLVTGCAGFIGAKVAEQLLDEGHTVIGVDDLNDAYDRRLKEWRLERLRRCDRFTFHHLDLRDPAGVEALWTESNPPDAVIHLAARAGVRASVEHPQIYVDTNVTGTLNLLERCRRTGVGKFVLSSTSSLYGAHNPTPYREDADTSRPLSPYAASKAGAEAICHAYHHLHGLDVTVLRYFTVYGPAGRPDMSLFRFVQWVTEGRPVVIYGDDGGSRDFTYVDDIARGTVAALRPLGYDVVNLGSDDPTVVLDVLRHIERLVGATARIEHRPRHPADVPTTWADIGKAGRVLGWHPETRWEDGVERLVSWYRDNRSWASTIATGA